MYPRRSLHNLAWNQGIPVFSGGEDPQTKPIYFDARLYKRMVDHALRERPNEGCGLIAFEDDRPVKVYPGTNILASPTRYRMDESEVLKADHEMERKGWWLGAIFHSHPTSPAVPSSTDLSEAYWPDAMMIIISTLDEEHPEVRAYRIDRENETYAEIPLVVQPARPSMLLDVLPDVRELARYALRTVTSIRVNNGQRQPGSDPIAAGGAVRAAQEVPDKPAVSSGESEHRATIGVLGGMGPMATVDLMGKIIRATPAETDQEHIPIVVYADPRVPDRTAALLHKGEDPAPWLIHGARQLASMEADFIVIPCNTAHAFLDQVQPQVEPQILSMIEAAANAIATEYPTIQTVGLLATSGTIQSGMYQQALRQYGFKTIIPDEDVQQQFVMPAIQAVKAGTVSSAIRELLIEASESLEDRGAHVILAACTEIPVVLWPSHLKIPLIDATDELAKLAVATARQIDAAASGAQQLEPV